MTTTHPSDDTAGQPWPTDDAGVIADSIRAAGLKVTGPRLAVLKALAGMPHSNADALFGAVRFDLPGTSLQAVYGVLASLGTVGLVRKIEPAGSPALFERRVGDNHHHIVCTGCSMVRDVDCAVGHTPCLTPADALGFDVSSAEVTYWGLCAVCQGDIGSRIETAHP